MSGDESLDVRRWIVRKVVAAVLALAIIGIYALHEAGYALLIEGGGSAAELNNGMVRLRCTYFTGTEKVITHISRSAQGGAGAIRCPLTTKLDRSVGNAEP